MYTLHAPEQAMLSRSNHTFCLGMQHSPNGAEGISEAASLYKSMVDDATSRLFSRDFQVLIPQGPRQASRAGNTKSGMS